jgi:tetratricopeptide (TPR) repeat protein
MALSQPLNEQPGDKIGRYKLLQQIGEGGFGVVYLAEQEEPVRRRVALKIIKLGMDTRQVIARFEAERQALAMMDHPNIAKVLDAGATASGRPFFVMEMVKGERITDYCDKNNLSTRQRLDLFVQICHAIQHAHQKGIIHRDIKPSNILVAMQDGAPVPKVIDFGIAKATEQRLTDKTVFTALGEFIGTPAYMSPEQAERTSLDIDTRSDIYSLGVLLYELLTGKTPFDVRELLAKGIEEMRRAIREEEPRRPSTRLTTMDKGELTTTARRRQTDAPKLLHQVRGDLDWIVMKCLEKDRTRRYDTANGLALDLLRHVHNEPVLARPPSSVYRFQKMVGRNKLACAAAAAIALALLLGVVVSAWQARRATLAGRAAEAARNQALSEADRATRAEALAKERLAESEAISKFLTEVFRSPDPARDGRTITVAEILSVAAKKLETGLTNQQPRQAKLQATIAATYDALGLYREEIPLREKVRDYYLAAFGPENLDTLDAMDFLARTYGESGRRDEAIKLYEQVLALRRKVNGPERHETLSTMNNLAISYDDFGRLAEALKLKEEVLALRRKVLGPQDPDTLAAMHNLAISYSHSGRRDEALKLREEVLPLLRKVYGPEHPRTLLAMNNLASSYDEVGRRDEALKLREQVLTLRRKVNGPEHPDTLRAMNNLSASYAEAGRYDEALKLREETLALRRKVLGPEHFETLAAMVNLVDSYVQADRRDEALKLGEETFPLARKLLGPEHSITLESMETLAEAYDLAGRRDEALKLQEQALALHRKVNGPEHPDTLSAMHALANSYDGAGRRDESLKLREQLLTLSRKVLAPGHPDTLEAMNELASTLATSDSAEIRNGTNAVHLAEEAVAATHRANAKFLDTLAAAYAETKQFEKAVAVEREALGLAKSEQEKKDCTSHLKLYQANTPFREPPKP